MLLHTTVARNPKRSQATALQSAAHRDTIVRLRSCKSDRTPKPTYFPQLLIFCCMLTLLSGCVPYHYDTCHFTGICEPCDPVTEENIELSRSHWLYKVVPRHRSQIRWYDLGHWTSWALFGNDDDGIFGEEPTAYFCKGSPPSLPKALAWAWRNPTHNLCFYALGSAHCVNDEFTLLRLTPCYKEAFVYRPQAATVFAGKGPSLYIGLHGGKPFISSRVVWSQTREGRFYIGWREKGNFGIRFNPFAHRKIEERTPPFSYTK